MRYTENVIPAWAVQGSTRDSVEQDGTVSLSAVSVVAAGSGQSRAGQGRKIRKYDLHSVDRLEELRHDMNEIVEIL